MLNQIAAQVSLPLSQTIVHPVKTENQDFLLRSEQKNTDKSIGIEKWFNTNDLKHAILIFRAINHPLRKAMMNLLEQKTTMTVTDIYITMRLEQSVASQHLRILRKANVVKTEKVGKFIYYTLNESKLNQLSQLISNVGSIN